MNSVVALLVPRTPSPGRSRAGSPHTTPRPSRLSTAGEDDLPHTPPTIDVVTPRATNGSRTALDDLTDLDVSNGTQEKKSFLEQLEAAERAQLGFPSEWYGSVTRGKAGNSGRAYHAEPGDSSEPSTHGSKEHLVDPMSSARSQYKPSWTKSWRARLQPRTRTPLFEPELGVDSIRHSASLHLRSRQPLAERRDLERMFDVEDYPTSDKPVRRSSIRRQVDKARSYASARLSGGSLRRNLAAGAFQAQDQPRAWSEMMPRRRQGVSRSLSFMSAIPLCQAPEQGSSVHQVTVETDSASMDGQRENKRPYTPITLASVYSYDEPQRSISSLVSSASVQADSSTTPRTFKRVPPAIKVAPLPFPAEPRDWARSELDPRISLPGPRPDSATIPVALGHITSPAPAASSSTGRWVMRRGNPRTRRGPRKRVWADGSEMEWASTYKVGWEREILDLEARMHEAMSRIAGQSHTFAVDHDDAPPSRVLDLGTGCGLWPIAQAHVWPDASFTGLDIVPCQVNLDALAASATRLSAASGDPLEVGLECMQSIGRIASRIRWDTADCFERLPYDSDSFDYAHIRFLGLGLSEDKLPDLLREVCRVLAPGGRLEWVEMSLDLAPNAPTQLRNSFQSLLQSESIDLNPSEMISTALSRAESLSAIESRRSLSEPAFQQTWRWGRAPNEAGPPDPLADAAMGWAKSMMEYRGTGCRRAKQETVIQRVKRELSMIKGEDWVFPPGLTSPTTPMTPGSVAHEACCDERCGVTVSAWVCVKS